MPPSILWFRRDLRLRDHPALLAAADAGDAVLPLFVLDDRLWDVAGAPRQAFLAGCLAALDESVGGRLVVRRGDPATVVPRVAAEVEAGSVFVTADFGPYGRRRDDAVEAAGVALERVGSPYAVEPGTLRTGGGEGYRVFTPFYRSWREESRVAPVATPEDVAWLDGVASDGLPSQDTDAKLPPAGEAAAQRQLDDFITDMGGYSRHRDRPDLDTTSRLSPYFKFGCLHPRQALARLGRSASAEKFRSELAWREFYADVLWHRPASARHPLQPAMARLTVDHGTRADSRFAAWAAGRTGYPFVDAGMRQLLTEAWMPNRVRMVTASFLVKDLHLPWTRGARWFMQHLVDGDLPSNQHNWQWVAGTGTDPSPFFRVFNPLTQAREHDPHGEYVRRWVPELASIEGAAVHQPWKLDGGPPARYPRPIVDHAAERRNALERYAEARER